LYNPASPVPVMPWCSTHDVPPGYPLHHWSTPPPSWGGGKVDVQVTPVLGTDWKGLYANAHCAALASEETNHTRKNGVCVSSSPPLWGQQPHAASLHHGLCLHEPCATRACSPHVPRPTKLLGEQGCIGWGACCGFAGHTVVLTLNGSHPGELHYKMAKGQCDTRGAWTSARPRAAHARASHNTQLPNQTAWRGAVWNPHTTSVWCVRSPLNTPRGGCGPAALTLQWGHPPAT
jgi:hypothetical protein